MVSRETKLLPCRAWGKIYRTFSDRITDEEWKLAIILDACRFDLFEELGTSHLNNGVLESRHSIASTTTEWLRRTFGNDTHHDIVYVTANPIYTIEDWVGTDLTDHFHEVINVWDDGWDDEFETVLPETMAEATIEAIEKFPNKRLC